MCCVFWNSQEQKAGDRKSDSSFKAAKLLDFDSTSNASSETTGNEETQVHGPTTRHKWSQWISRPPPAQSASSVSDTENVSEANVELLSLVEVVKCSFNSQVLAHGVDFPVWFLFITWCAEFLSCELCLFFFSQFGVRFFNVFSSLVKSKQMSLNQVNLLCVPLTWYLLSGSSRLQFFSVKVWSNTWRCKNDK